MKDAAALAQSPSGGQAKWARLTGNRKHAKPGAMLKTLKRKALHFGLALALPLAGCAQTAPPEAATPAAAAATGGKPAMWKVADDDTTIYLFGTIHLLPAGTRWRTPALEAALARADELVLEVADVDDPAAGAQAMAKLGLGVNLPPIAERVPADKREALKSMIAETGYPAAIFDRLETWAAGLTLLSVTFKRLGLDPSLGVERQIDAPFRSGAKRVLGLETIEEQLSLFDGLPEDAQRAFLVGVLDEGEHVQAEFKAMLDAWLAGDVGAIEKTFNDEANLSPQLRQALLDRRNARWAEWLDERMDRPGTVFVAVGAGHLAGPASVQVLLKKRGIASQRVQ
jgi:hypothetical protein